MRAPRTRSSARDSARRSSCPSNRTTPFWISAFPGSKRSSAAASVLLPEPDSPSTPRVSPGSSVKLTLASAVKHCPVRAVYATWRFWTSRRSAIGSNRGRSLPPPYHGVLSEPGEQGRRAARRSNGNRAHGYLSLFFEHSTHFVYVRVLQDALGATAA